MKLAITFCRHELIWLCLVRHVDLLGSIASDDPVGGLMDEDNVHTRLGLASFLSEVRCDGGMELGKKAQSGRYYFYSTEVFTFASLLFLLSVLCFLHPIQIGLFLDRLSCHFNKVTAVYDGVRPAAKERRVPGSNELAALTPSAPDRSPLRTVHDCTIG